LEGVFGSKSWTHQRARTPGELVQEVLTLVSVFVGRRYEHCTTGLRKRIAPARQRM